MHPELLDLLACPSCQGDLSLEANPRASREGSLACWSCKARYPVISGIPRFVPSEDASASNRIANQFEVEFSTLRDQDRDMDPLELREYYFFSRTGLDPAIYEAIPFDPYRTEVPDTTYRPDGTFLKNQLVLDAGCGPARFTEIAALHGSRLVVGLDLGDHIDRAASRCAHLQNVAFVQGSLLSPPFKPGVFNVVFSIGVIHHTPAPKIGLSKLVEVVAPGGLLSVWVYPPEYWGRGPQRAIARALHRWISHMDPQSGLRFCERWLYPLGMLQMKVHRNRAFRYLFAPLFLIKVPRHPSREVMLATIFDYYAPIHISTHAPDELAGWLQELGLAEVQTLPVQTSAIGKRRVRKAQ